MILKDIYNFKNMKFVLHNQADGGLKHQEMENYNFFRYFLNASPTYAVEFLALIKFNIFIKTNYLLMEIYDWYLFITGMLILVEVSAIFLLVLTLIPECPLKLVLLTWWGLSDW